MPPSPPPVCRLPPAPPPPSARTAASRRTRGAVGLSFGTYPPSPSLRGGGANSGLRSQRDPPARLIGGSRENGAGEAPPPFREGDGGRSGHVQYNGSRRPNAPV